MDIIEKAEATGQTADFRQLLEKMEATGTEVILITGWILMMRERGSWEWMRKR